MQIASAKRRQLREFREFVGQLFEAEQGGGEAGTSSGRRRATSVAAGGDETLQGSAGTVPDQSERARAAAKVTVDAGPGNGKKKRTGALGWVKSYIKNTHKGDDEENDESGTSAGEAGSSSASPSRLAAAFRNRIGRGVGGGSGSGRGKSAAAAAAAAAAVVSSRDALEVEYRVHLGSQHKTVATARLRVGTVMEACVPTLTAPTADDLRFEVHAETARTLYSEALRAAVLLVPEGLDYESATNRAFARAATVTSELHFPDFDAQVFVWCRFCEVFAGIHGGR